MGHIKGIGQDCIYNICCTLRTKTQQSPNLGNKVFFFFSNEKTLYLVVMCAIVMALGLR